jgi:hypothetical protein
MPLAPTRGANDCTYSSCRFHRLPNRADRMAKINGCGLSYGSSACAAVNINNRKVGGVINHLGINIKIR